MLDGSEPERAAVCVQATTERFDEKPSRQTASRHISAAGRHGSVDQHPRQMPYFSRLSTFWSVAGTSDCLPLWVATGRPPDDGAQPFGAIRDIEVS